MSYNITGLLIECFDSSEDIDAYTLVSADQTIDHGVVKSKGGNEYIKGVSMCTVSSGMRLDVMTIGLCEVRLGQAVLAGEPITSDINGLGVKAIGGEYIVGFSVTKGVAGEIIPVRVLGQHL